VGERTTFDVLDAQRDLLNSQIGLVLALRDRSWRNIHSTPRSPALTRKRCELSVPYCDPLEHYENRQKQVLRLASSAATSSRYLKRVVKCEWPKPVR